MEGGKERNRPGEAGLCSRAGIQAPWALLNHKVMEVMMEMMTWQKLPVTVVVRSAASLAGDKQLPAVTTNNTF